MMKKIFSNILILVIAIPLMFPITVEGKTLGNLIKELNELEEKASNTNTNINKTQEEIQNTKESIARTSSQISEAEEEMVKAAREIEELKLDIESKKEDSAKVLSYLQKTGGEINTLEYVLDAENTTDFIYRKAVVEQLSRYNNNLIEEMNSSIKQNEQKQIDLEKKEEQLKKLQEDLSSKLVTLGREKSVLDEYSQSLADEIKIAKEVIETYKKAGCKENEDIQTCGKRVIPADTAFWRPMGAGYVTSEYNPNRNLNGSTSFHAAIDLSSSNKTTEIYASASGKVAKVIYSNSGGGNQVIIHHNIVKNGKTTTYTTYYAHLSKIYVSSGDVVNKNTVIGLMGSTGNSTGPHLHFGIAYGHWYKDYYSYYSGFVPKSINPRSLINFPSGRYNSWVNRTTYYK